MAPRRAACVALRHDMSRRPPLLAATLLAIPHTQARREVVVMCKINKSIIVFLHMSQRCRHIKKNEIFRQS